MTFPSDRAVVLARKAFFAYIALIVYLCSYPWGFQPTGAGMVLQWDSTLGRSGWADLVLNLLFYVPVGVLGSIGFRNRYRLPLLLAFSFALTISVELLQAYLPGRTSSLRDVATNLMGTLVGVALVPILLKLPLPAVRARGRYLLNPISVALLALFVASQTFPGIPNFRLPHLKAVLARLPMIPSPLDLTAAFLVFLAVSVLFRLLIHPPLSRFPVFALLAGYLLILRPFFASTSYTVLELVACLFGIVIGLLGKTEVNSRVLAVGLLVYILARQFSPFAFLEPANAFTWIPFAGLFDLPLPSMVRILAEKAFLYGVSIEFLRRVGIPLPVSAGAVLAALAAGEAAQRYLPGRTPESTDLVLALVMALIIGAASIASADQSQATNRPADGRASDGRPAVGR